MDLLVRNDFTKGLRVVKEHKKILKQLTKAETWEEFAFELMQAEQKLGFPLDSLTRLAQACCQEELAEFFRANVPQHTTIVTSCCLSDEVKPTSGTLKHAIIRECLLRRMAHQVVYDVACNPLTTEGQVNVYLMAQKLPLPLPTTEMENEWVLERHSLWIEPHEDCIFVEYVTEWLEAGLMEIPSYVENTFALQNLMYNILDQALCTKERQWSLQNLMRPMGRLQHHVVGIALQKVDYPVTVLSKGS